MPQFSRTWWGQRFLEALETFTDPARLGRGRSYARNGKVVHYALEKGTVRAKVRGSINPYFGVYKEPTYTASITMKPIARADWDRAIATLSSKAGFVAKLLLGEMPDTIDEAFEADGVHLLPHDSTDFETYCSCPDWANPCKHIAGVYYLLASDLDRDPFLLFELRGLTRKELQFRLKSSRLGQILADALTPEEVPITPAASFYTTPREHAMQPTYREFWMGAKRLPPFEPSPPPTVPALLIKKQGDYPSFWRKDASFIDTMEEIYTRVRSKSPDLK